MAFTQTDLDNINNAIASGELTVEVNGKRVTYRSMDELMKARLMIKSDMAMAEPSTNSVRRGSYRVTFATHRGE
jgi:hypothetical protein